MLSKTKVVRKAIESLYIGKCTVTEHQKVKKSNGSTGFSDVAVLEDQACRLSFNTVQTITQNEDGSASEVQTVTLFISPDVRIAPGSKITVTQNGVTEDYMQSGEPAMHTNHQEIPLELYRERS